MKNNQKEFTAEFEGYEFSQEIQKIRFINVKDKEGNLVKKSFWVDAIEHSNLLGTMTIGSIITFGADVITNTDSPDGLDLANFRLVARQ